MASTRRKGACSPYNRCVPADRARRRGALLSRLLAWNFDVGGCRSPALRFGMPGLWQSVRPHILDGRSRAAMTVRAPRHRQLALDPDSHLDHRHQHRAAQEAVVPARAPVGPCSRRRLSIPPRTIGRAKAPNSPTSSTTDAHIGCATYHRHVSRRARNARRNSSVSTSALVAGSGACSRRNVCHVSPDSRDATAALNPDSAASLLLFPGIPMGLQRTRPKRSPQSGPR